jgi:hypothetical protein
MGDRRPRQGRYHPRVVRPFEQPAWVRRLTGEPTQENDKGEETEIDKLERLLRTNGKREE